MRTFILLWVLVILIISYQQFIETVPKATVTITIDYMTPIVPMPEKVESNWQRVQVQI